MLLIDERFRTLPKEFSVGGVGEIQEYISLVSSRI
jgi:hypothetical protein